MVLSGLENQSHCWKGLTVSSPDWNMQSKESVVTFVLLLLWSLVKSQSRNKWRIPVVHPAKQLGRDRALGTGVWEWPQGSAAPAWCQGSRSPTRAEMKALDMQLAWWILPHGLCRDRVSQGMLGFYAWGARKIVHIIFSRLQAKSYSFYLQKLFQAID